MGPAEFYTKAKGRIVRILRDRSIKRAHDLHKRQHEAEYQTLDTMVSSFRESGGLKHDFQSYKLWCLEQLLKKYRPKKIVEFGSGSSTMVFSEYAKNNQASILSVDENQGWADNTRNLIKGDQSHVQIVAKTKIFKPGTPEEIKYEMDGTVGDFDFAFIDGPSLELDGQKKKNAVNSNIFDFSKKPDIIVVDVRKATALEIAKRYGNEYEVMLSDLFTDKPVPLNYNYFSVFKKKAA
jgi:hypothetical protein